jgi:hypothetical protein
VITWCRGRRVSPLATGYQSFDGRYRVDRVKYGQRTLYRALIRWDGRWERLEGSRVHRTRTAAEAACEKHERLPPMSQL